MADIKRAVFDVDNCIACGYGCCLRPGMKSRMQRMVKEGWEIHLWSGGGERWVVSNAKRLRLMGVVTGFHGKADYPMKLGDVRAVLGFTPDLTVDNDANEALDGVPFEHVETWWGKHLEIKLPKREAMGDIYF